MKTFDRYLQNKRMCEAIKYIPNCARIIDIGTHNGEIFNLLGHRLIEGFGIEPILKCRIDSDKYSLHPGYFPLTAPKEKGWDAITMLAVLEHIPTSKQLELVNACWEYLRPGGVVIITVPSPYVDYILHFLHLLRIIDGMSMEEHFGFRPQTTIELFKKPQFELLCHKRFQLGLNNIFIFKKI